MPSGCAMTDPSPLLTPGQLLGAVANTLVAAGFRRVEEQRERRPTDLLLFEDAFAIVAAGVFESCDRLIREWSACQGWLVETMSAHLSKAEAKSWDGYLVLLTTSLPTELEQLALEHITRDTSHTRKLVASGERLRTLVDVDAALAPFLPVVSASQQGNPGAILDDVRRLLRTHGVRPATSEAIVDAFINQENMVEAIFKSDRAQP